MYSDCVDKQEVCELWAQSGFCDSAIYPQLKEFMEMNCRRSCKLCGKVWFVVVDLASYVVRCGLLILWRQEFSLSAKMSGVGIYLIVFSLTRTRVLNTGYRIDSALVGTDDQQTIHN